MSIDTKARQPEGSPVGGQYAVDPKGEAVGIDLVADRGEVLGGLRLEGDFTDGGRALATRVSRSGLLGTVTDEHDRSEEWSALTVTLATGDELRVRTAVNANGRCSALTVYFSCSEDGPHLDGADDQAFGGIRPDADTFHMVRHVLMQVAARESFNERFPATPGLELLWIGEESIRDYGWIGNKDLQQQASGASFNLDGANEVLVKNDVTRDDGIELEVDGSSIDVCKPFLLALTCNDLNRRLGVLPAAAQTPDRALSFALGGVIDRARLLSVWAANIDESKAGML